MEDHDLSSQYRTLTRLHRSLVQQYLDPYGLYMGQPRLLFYIQTHEQVTQKKLAEVTENTKESVSVSIKRLESAGFVESRVNPKDKREKYLHLTHKGNEVAEEVHQRFHVLNEAMFEPLNESERIEISGMFDRMIERLSIYKKEGK